MRYRTRFLTALAVVLLAGLLGSAHAQQKLFFGTRYLGMGNAGVGASQDGLAVHYNPAGMAFSRSWDLELPLATIDVDLRGDLISQLDKIGDVDITGLQNRLNGNGIPVSEQELGTLLDTFLFDVGSLDQSGQGATLQGSAGPAFRFKNWGVSVSAFGNGGAGAVIDLSQGISLSSADFATAIPMPTPNACMGDQFCEDFAGRLQAANGALDRDRAEVLAEAVDDRIENNPGAQQLLENIVASTGSNDTLATNSSGAITAGVVFGQIAGTYSHKILSNLAIGGNLKYMTGETSLIFATVSELSDGEQVIEDLLESNNTVTVSDFALDIGVMWRPTGNSSIGLVGNNLNSPSFDFTSQFGPVRKYDFEPSFRIGGAWRPLKWFNVAADYDLNELESNVIPSVSFRYLNLGTEFLAGRWFGFQLGAFSNLAANNSDPTITTGLGFYIGGFEISLAGAFSTASQDVNVGDDSQSIPREAAVALQLAWRQNKTKKNRTANFYE